MSAGKHSPTPWNVVDHGFIEDATGLPIVQADKLPDARIICLAVNLHDDLVEALVRLEYAANAVGLSNDNPRVTVRTLNESLDKARAVLARAGETK